jgi:threonine dehydratase
VVAGALAMDESAIADAMRYAKSELGVTIEGSAAVALAPLLACLPAPLRGGDFVAVLTGQNVDAARV